MDPSEAKAAAGHDDSEGDAEAHVYAVSLADGVVRCDVGGLSFDVDLPC